MRRIAHLVCCFPLLAVGDSVLIALGFLLAFFLRFGFSVSGMHLVERYAYYVPAFFVAGFLCLFVTGLYTNWLHRGVLRLATSIVAGCTLIGIVTMAIGFWGRHFGVPRDLIPASVLLQVIALLLFRLPSQYLHEKFIGPKRVLVIGQDEDAVANLVFQLRTHQPSWFRVIGYLPTRGLAELEGWLSDIDVIAITADFSARDKILGICSKNNKEVLLIPTIFDVFLHSAQAEAINDTLAFSIRPSSLTYEQMMVKRAVDVIGSALMLAVAAPVMLLLCVIIPLSSKGGPIYRQERTGRYGHRFFIYKFRTMVRDAERHTGPTLAGKDDVRITSFGRLLRAARLDELPQILNVLKGDMSLVGPRPERPIFIERFERDIPHYNLRSQVKPGITGLAQVKGSYSTAADRKLGFDLLYIFNYSLLFDLKILLQTFWVVFKPERATGVEVDFSGDISTLLEHETVSSDLVLHQAEDPQLAADLASD